MVVMVMMMVEKMPGGCRYSKMEEGELKANVCGNGLHCQRKDAF